MRVNDWGQIVRSQPETLMSFDWGDPFNSAAQNVGSGFTDVGQAGKNAFQPGRGGQALASLGLGGTTGLMLNQGGGDALKNLFGGGGQQPGGGQNWFGYMPEHLQAFDQMLNDIMSGKSQDNPYMKGMQDRVKQNIRGASADRGTFYSGGSVQDETRGLADLFNQTQQGQIGNLLQYLNIARPQALAPQAAQPSTTDQLWNLVGKVAPAAIAALF